MYVIVCVHVNIQKNTYLLCIDFVIENVIKMTNVRNRNIGRVELIYCSEKFSM